MPDTELKSNLLALINNMENRPTQESKKDVGFGLLN